MQQSYGQSYGEELKPLVFDLGSRFTKCGFGGDDDPRFVIPTVVGQSSETYDSSAVVGSGVFDKLDSLKVNHPIIHGTVKNWDDIEKFFHHCFYKELRVSPQEHPILLSERILSPKANREKMIQTMFEVFNVPAYYVYLKPTGSLYSCGRTTGLVLTCGHGVSSVLPIYEGYISSALKNRTFLRMNLGGGDVTSYMTKLFVEKGYELKDEQGLETARKMKEKHCYVALSSSDEKEKYEQTSYETQEYQLPDGDRVTIASERFQGPEILFSPSIVGSKNAGLSKMLHRCVQNIDIHHRLSIYENVIVAGGSTMFSGFEKRLEHDLKEMAHRGTKVKIIAPSNRKTSSWVGGSILCSLNTFQNLWIDKEEYDDAGPSIVHRKCPSI